jgi:hypothetical protein
VGSLASRASSRPPIAQSRLLPLTLPLPPPPPPPLLLLLPPPPPPPLLLLLLLLPPPLLLPLLLLLLPLASRRHPSMVTLMPSRFCATDFAESASASALPNLQFKHTNVSRKSLK